MISYVFLGISVLIGIGGQMLFKAGAMGQSSGNLVGLHYFTWFAFAAYFVAALLYSLSLKTIPVSVAYPTLSISYVAVAYLAHLLFGENFGAPQILALALIGAGIVILYRG